VAEKGGGATALHYALKRLTCEKPDPRLIQVLLEAGADPNARLNNGNSVLDEAASLGHIDLVELLLKAGAEPNPPENSIGQSALCAASGGGHVEMVRLLLDRGANVNCVDAYKATPLMAAAHAWRIEIVDILLGAGANVNVTDWKERTPLIHASLDASDIASQQDAERALSVMRGLIEAGASVNVKDIKGRTALDYALQSDRKELGQYLKGQGAKPGTKAR
jgi:ankyrin repeat protein